MMNDLNFKIVNLSSVMSFPLVVFFSVTIICCYVVGNVFVSVILSSVVARVCKSEYLLSVNFMAAKNPDILVANPDIRYPDIRIYPLFLWQPKIRIS